MAVLARVLPLLSTGFPQLANTIYGVTMVYHPLHIALRSKIWSKCATAAATAVRTRFPGAFFRDLGPRPKLGRSFGLEVHDCPGEDSYA
jgi:hypothetical protein